jgi:hypothetical protein
MVQSIQRMVPVARNQGVQVPNLIPLSEWCDSLLLVANTAQSYTLKQGQLAPLQDGALLRINAVSTARPLYVDPTKVAVIPTATTTNGASAVLLQDVNQEPVLLAMPAGQTVLSLISTAGGIVTIEAWT